MKKLNVVDCNGDVINVFEFWYIINYVRIKIFLGFSLLCKSKYMLLWKNIICYVKD